MARSQIIKDLIDGDKSITVSLQKLLVIVDELENKELKEWAKNELNGYGADEDIPDYRKNLPFAILYSGMNGSFLVKNQPLVINSFGDYADEVRKLNIITNSILELENLKGGTLQYDLTKYAEVVKKNMGISCISIVLKYGYNVADSILSSVKTKVLESLLYLEKEFGLLDELFIADSKLDKSKIEKTNHNINSIIFSDGVRY
ncbi:MAG TPA: hypothetical protein P5064_01360 [Clostridia bacterium]|nr:hypothetical protein [Clostridiaceae bacterium]HOM34714.1 hypothetical protein [Clostridia bacterium]HOR90325.1 hypothetical protein [Clostridia bacterium]HOT70251.1 hypothetical protein [Clostridia bacterium]HQG00485.1 hypothetical protein [Clostridia bacterium]